MNLDKVANGFKWVNNKSSMFKVWSPHFCDQQFGELQLFQIFSLPDRFYNGIHSQWLQRNNRQCNHDIFSWQLSIIVILKLLASQDRHTTAWSPWKHSEIMARLRVINIRLIHHHTSLCYGIFANPRVPFICMDVKIPGRFQGSIASVPTLVIDPNNINLPASIIDESQITSLSRRTWSDIRWYSCHNG